MSLASPASVDGFCTTWEVLEHSVPIFHYLWLLFCCNHRAEWLQQGPQGLKSLKYLFGSLEMTFLGPQILGL